MADESFKIKIEDDSGLINALRNFPRQAQQYLAQAGDQAATDVIFTTPGTKQYPPVDRPTRASVYGSTWKSEKQRRWFFASLRDGTIEVPYRRGQSPGSEDYQAQWYTKKVGYGTEIGNRASYAHWLGGDDQSQYHAVVGWRKLTEVVAEKIGRITEIYNTWIAKLLRDVGIR